MSITSGKTSYALYSRILRSVGALLWEGYGYTFDHWIPEYMLSLRATIVPATLPQTLADTSMLSRYISKSTTNTFPQRPSGPPPLQPSAVLPHLYPPTAKASASPTQTTSPSSCAPSTTPRSRSNTPPTPRKQPSPASRPAASTSPLAT